MLVTVDLPSGICTQVGNLGDNFSSLTFRKDGQLFGTTGNGATVPETLYLIDKTNATKTLAVGLGNGADGEVICYNPVDDKMYHWSGNGTVVFESFPPSTPYTPVTNIPITGTTGGETFGALHWNLDSFLVSNISSNFLFATSTGVYGTTVHSNPDDIRGMAMPPVFAVEEDTVCTNTVARVGAAGVADYQVIYAWGDGQIDTVQSGSGSHNYASQGNYTVNVLLHYGDCTPDTFWTQNIRVNAVPVVTLSGSGNLCPGGAILLTGTSGGTSQWYQDGALISGANSNAYSASAPGLYNMIKTNLNGCADSAAVGITVVNVSAPTVSLGNDLTVCGSTVLDAGNVGATYLWSDNSTAQTLTASATGVYVVTVTDANTCTGTDAISITVNPLPDVNVPSNQSVCVNTSTSAITFTGSLGGTTYDWTNNDPSIGLAASGTGDIAAFTGLNATNAPVTATITVTPTSSGTQLTPELLYYKFDGSGTSVPNLASAPPLGTANATIMGGLTQGAASQCDGSLIGSGVASSTDYLNTGWATNLSGTSWTISFKSSNITPSATLFYIFGDASAGSFRCFTNGVAGANNWILRGGFTDVYINGGATVAPHTNTFVYDAVAGDIKAYLDGALVSTVAQAGPTIAGAGPFKVMGYGSNVGAPAGGLLDEFMVFSHALSVTEIQTLASGCNSAPCVGTPQSFDITVNPNPVVALGADLTECYGTTLDAGNAGSAYLWSDNSTSQTLSTSNSGNYAVTVTDVNTCTGTDDIDVTINPAPVVTLGSDITQCGGSTTLDAGNAGASYTWSDASSNQTLTVFSTGNYYVDVTDANNCIGIGTINVTINTPPTVALGTNITQCGGSASLDAGNAGASYLWSDGSNTQTVSVSATGNIGVTVTDANTCTGTDNVDVTINTPPTVALGSDVTQCGGTATLDAGNAGASYIWSDGSTTQTVSVTATGTIGVTVTDANTCTGTDNVDVTINTIPVASLTLADDSACTGSSAIVLTGGSPAGGVFSGANVSGGSFTPSASGTFTIAYEYADGNGCKDTAYADITVYVCVGINELTSGSVLLYPNPSHDYVTLKTEGINGKIQLEIFDMSGKKVEQTNGVSVYAGYTQTINLAKYATGTYVVNITTESGSVKYNLIVQ